MKTMWTTKQMLSLRTKFFHLVYCIGFSLETITKFLSFKQYTERNFSYANKICISEAAHIWKRKTKSKPKPKISAEKLRNCNGTLISCKIYFIENGGKSGGVPTYLGLACKSWLDITRIWACVSGLCKFLAYINLNWNR